MASLTERWANISAMMAGKALKGNGVNAGGNLALAHSRWSSGLPGRIGEMCSKFLPAPGTFAESQAWSGGLRRRCPRR